MDILIIGAGAAGLMAARELSARLPAQAGGKKVVVLEARDRIGGRIFPLPEHEFGYPAQGGAEFLHGEATITRALVAEADLTLIEPRGKWVSVGSGVRPDEADNAALKQKLAQLKTDVTVAAFFETHFSDEKYARLRASVFGRVQGYDAGDPAHFSALALRDELSSPTGMTQAALKEGYGALLSFLLSKLEANGAEIVLNKKVTTVQLTSAGVEVTCSDKSTYQAEQVLITVPLPLIAEIEFTPAIPEKIAAAAQIGFGPVIKIVLAFKNRWWIGLEGGTFDELHFLFSDEEIPTWWTQFPETHPSLTGWLAGPKAGSLSERSDEDLLGLALTSLSHVFKLPEQQIRDELKVAKVLNWQHDPLARGAYSYATVGIETAIALLREPIEEKLFFAGEALCEGEESTTVEGALQSGKEAALRMGT